MEVYHLVPILTGFLYTVAALCIKRATTHGIGPWRTTFVSNLVLFLFAFPLWFFGEPIEDWSTFWMPVLVGTGFFGGQILSCFAIHKGDISVFTPLMGMKTLFVGVIVSFVLGESLAPSVWLGAVLSAVAILLMRGRTQLERKRVALTIILGLGCSISYAISDSAMQAFGSTLGFHKLTAGTFTVVMLYSILLIPFFRGSVASITRKSWLWLLVGAGLMAIQASLMAFAMSTYGKATEINVIYSARGVWGVVLVWTVGHWFSNQEKSLGGGTFVRRLIGALLLVAAIFIVMR